MTKRWREFSVEDTLEGFEIPPTVAATLTVGKKVPNGWETPNGLVATHGFLSFQASEESSRRGVGMLALVMMVAMTPRTVGDDKRVARCTQLDKWHFNNRNFNEMES